MYDLTEDISTLHDLGLTVTQAKVYLTLAKAGKLTVHEASKLSGVARPHAYQAMEELEAAGLIIRVIDYPERFFAISLEECTSNLWQNRIEETAKLQRQTMLLKQHFKTNLALNSSDTALQFTLIPERHMIYAKADKMLHKVQESIDFLCLTRRMLAWLSNSLSSVEEVLARNVVFRVIMPRPALNKDLWKPIRVLDNYDNCTLRFIPHEPNFGFSVWDGKEILMTTSPVDSSTPASTLWSNNKGLADLCQEHFCCLWKKAKES